MSRIYKEERFVFDATGQESAELTEPRDMAFKVELKKEDEIFKKRAKDHSWDLPTCANIGRRLDFSGGKR